MSVIDVTKPAGKVFETAMLDAERAIAGTMSSGIEIAARIAKLLKDCHTGDEEADYISSSRPSSTSSLARTKTPFASRSA
jgi:hypothetical protein